VLKQIGLLVLRSETDSQVPMEIHDSICLETDRDQVAVEFCSVEVISLCILLLLSKLGVVDAISNKQVQSLQDMTYQEVYLEGDETCLARPQVEQK